MQSRLVRCLLAVTVGLSPLGCRQAGNGVTFTDPAPAAAPSQFQPVRIVSGSDGRPVPGARVSIDGEGPDLSNVRGEVVPSDYILATYGVAAGMSIDVDAAGFLPRRTRVPSDRVVTLWPVADATEAEAVRRMVYGRGGPLGEVLYPPDPGPLTVHLPVDGFVHQSPWGSEAAVFGARFGISYKLSFGMWYFDEPLARNSLAVYFSRASCGSAGTWGFCQALPEQKVFAVRPERAADPQTIRRVLASFFLGPDPLPGLLNVDAPADDLSSLEVQTIRMILLRRLPNRWPDTDR